MIRRICIVLLGLLVFWLAPAAAQESRGQFCIRSYEDVNANGLFDTESERLITRGVGVELLDNSGMVVGSALLDKSPNASSGIICFYNLAEGDYSVLVSSADYIATTDRLVQENVSNTAPTIIEFGARRMGSEAIAQPLTPAESEMDALLSPMRIAAATVAAAVIMVLFMLTGFIVYGVRSRRATPQPQPIQYRPDSVQDFEPVNQADNYAAPPFDEPPISDEDTNPVQN